MIKQFLVWLLYKNSAVWLFYILAFEYYVAMNVSPTILTDYPVLNSFVETMSFIPAVHNFDDRAVHPEAISFYIALAFVLLIPKAISILNWLVKNPIVEMRQYVITPLTTTKPASTKQISSDTWMTKEQVKAQPTVPRSIVSRIFWSMMTLMFMIATILLIANYGYGSERPHMKSVEISIYSGGYSMWLQLSLVKSTFAALLVAISLLIIQDYIKWFLSFRKQS